MTDIITTKEAQEGFYPTPEKVAVKLLEGLDWWKLDSILEPSAGKGNLIATLSEMTHRDQYRPHRSEYRHVRVDCIEIDPYLRSILAYEFCGQRQDELVAEYSRLREKENHYDTVARSYGKLTEGEKKRKEFLGYEISRLKHTDVHIVHDDFLTFDSRKSYSLILMNPPFSNGDEHLLKAIQMQSRSGGEIRCILNAETLRNPYTNRRKYLMKKLLELNADVTFHTEAFSDAERKTDVDIAIVKLDITEPKHDSEFYDRLRTAAQIQETPAEDVTDLTVADFMERIVTQFNVEVDAGLALIREYKAMKPYILQSLSREEKYNCPNLTLVVGSHDRYHTLSENEYLELTRQKYWDALFTNKEFVGQLTSNLREKYRKTVGRMSAYDFTLFNIQQVMTQMNAEMGQGIQDTIVKLFDRMTEAHSWYPECEKNTHYFNGWKTNKVHKINSKVILPVNGMFADVSWHKKPFNLCNAEATIADIEKVFDYLDGNMTAPVDLHGVLERACEEGQTKNIQCKYFSVTLYKKGTMHIKFHDQALVDRFNIYCCGKKGWLPPSYGRATYSGMTSEEKAVVDGFNGDGTEGSGAKAYTEIQKNQGYYLSEPTNNTLALMSPA